MQCTICDKIFTQLNNLTTHIQYIRIKASKREYNIVNHEFHFIAWRMEVCITKL